MLKYTLRRWLALSCIALLTTACGGGGGGSGDSNSGTSSSSSTSSTSSAPSNTPSSSPSTSPSVPSESLSRIVNISWSIPSTRADGTPLATSAISAYRLFYTRDGSASSEDTVVVISNGSATNTNITLGTAGTYTFAITAIDLDGAESALSTPTSVTIN